MNRRSLRKGPIGDYGIETVRLPTGQVVDLDILRHPGASAVVPLHADGTVTLIHQHRHAAGGMIWEIPAGKLEPGEAPERCAARELAEEANLAGELTLLSSILTTPAFTDEVIHVFLATKLVAAEGTPDDDEFIRPVRMPFAEAMEMVATGRITDAKTMIGLLLTERRLRG
jgi:ADP-ribose pyrophosphatase